jgi:hypothetical protein
MERGSCDWSRSVAKEARVRLEIRHRLAGVDVEDLDAMFLCSTMHMSVSCSMLWSYTAISKALLRQYLRCKDRCVFMHTESPQMVRCCQDRLHTLIHTDVPQFDLATATAAHEFALTTSLQMHVGDPLLVLFPDLDHGSCRLLPLVVDSNSTITETGHEDITLYLIRGEGCDAGSRTRGYILGESAWGTTLVWYITYTGANFGACIPHTNHLDITSNQDKTPSLLPVKYKSGILVARNKIGQGSEACN